MAILEGAKKRFPRVEICDAWGDRPAVNPQKNKAVSGSCSEQDDKRFRIHLVRPRAEAHFGAEGRASSQRSIDYHSRCPRCQEKTGSNSGGPCPAPRLRRAIFPCTRSCVYKLDANGGSFDARAHGPEIPDSEARGSTWRRFPRDWGQASTLGSSLAERR
jgi:hypothetical protein